MSGRTEPNYRDLFAEYERLVGIISSEIMSVASYPGWDHQYDPFEEAKPYLPLGELEKICEKIGIGSPFRK